MFLKKMFLSRGNKSDEDWKNEKESVIGGLLALFVAGAIIYLSVTG